MKYLLLLCVLINVLSMYAGSAQESFLKGNAAYAASNFDSALTLYQAIQSKGVAVWHNMGNCYYHKGDYVQAIVHWQRALKNATLTDFFTLQSYIARAYADAGVPYEVSGKARLRGIIGHVLSRCTNLTWQLLCLACWFVFIFLLTKKRLRYRVMVLVGSCLAMVGCVFALIVVHTGEIPQGIVIKNSISVYAGPGSDYAQIGHATLLDMVYVYEQRDNWMRVYGNSCGYGWVQVADIDRVY